MFDLFCSQWQLAQEVLQFIMSFVAQHASISLTPQESVETVQVLNTHLADWVQTDAIQSMQHLNQDPELMKLLMEEAHRIASQLLH